jgi:hemerythrin-like domain-containing protein
MKWMYGILLSLCMAILPGYAEDQPSSNDIITRMQTSLNLSEKQVYNITPVIEKYVDQMQDLQKSINDGTINQSAIDSQKQQIKAVEDQGLSQYLDPNQISQWNYIQSQDQKGKDDADGGADADEYSNLPRDIPSQN